MMKVVTLGTAGGPRWFAGDTKDRTGIATAIVVGERFYLVDAGHGVGRRIRQAGLDLDDLGGIFITHMHSDHTIDLPSLIVFGMQALHNRADDPVPIVGPGQRGALPPVSPRALVPPRPVAPANPTPGVSGLFAGIVAAYATDINDRVLDALRPSPEVLFDPRDIVVPEGIGYHPNTDSHPEMEPFVIFKDDLITVTATLVDHPPLAPAFAFRFDSEHGSVTISGDTCESANLVRLAQDTDLLLHEAIDFEWVDGMYAQRQDDNGRAVRDHHYKSHTSVAGAIRVANAAGAKTLALHHLVPSIADDAVWTRGREEFTGTFLVPDDLDVLTVGAAVDAAVRS
ncbi:MULTISPECIES: MBL fold metallo-hydrolase [unclassified Brevibacterium]|uniref:MBL fold metallo-hydrolase n=1 Tax=unclassified Brevibacterium TaxID=2614124 RepID=UPI002016BDC3|nr:MULTISPECIES: MBL fold metallo-hydrolase [unclassified Brevibacterium]MCM1014018.1 MBL fold metallo-hydrolase [Brevibacterium sp. XM4083]